MFTSPLPPSQRAIFFVAFLDLIKNALWRDAFLLFNGVWRTLGDPENMSFGGGLAYIYIYQVHVFSFRWISCGILAGDINDVRHQQRQFGSKCSVLLQAWGPLQRAGAFAAASPTQLKPRRADIASCYRLFGWLFRGLVWLITLNPGVTSSSGHDNVAHQEDGAFCTSLSMARTVW